MVQCIVSLYYNAFVLSPVLYYIFRTLLLKNKSPATRHSKSSADIMRIFLDVCLVLTSTWVSFHEVHGSTACHRCQSWWACQRPWTRESMTLNLDIFINVIVDAAVKGKGKGTYTWYSTSSWIISLEALRYGTCCQGISQSYLHTHTFNLQSQWAIPAFAFSATAASRLPSPEGWKAELAWVAGYMMRQFTCPKAVTHPTTNRAQCSATCVDRDQRFTTALKLPQWFSLVDLLTLCPAAAVELHRHSARHCGAALCQTVRTSTRQHAWCRRLRHCLPRMSAFVYFSS